MPFSGKIKERKHFVDRLTISEVAAFCGVDAQTVRRRCPDVGSVNVSGQRIYTVADACEAFYLINARRPLASETFRLYTAMGLLFSDYLEAYILRLYARGLIQNTEPYDEDLVQ